MKQLINKRLKAYTLTELLVVLIIIGILVLIALPNLMPLISRAHSVEAQTNLNHVYNLQKSHFYQYAKYSDNLRKIGFEQEKLVAEGGQAKYKIKIVSSSPSGFVARAESTVDFDGDGTLNIWEINQEKQLSEVQPD